MQSYRLRLMLAWVVGGGLVLTVMILQTSLGHYGDDAEAAWQWLIPNLVPSLTLVLGVSAFTKPEPVDMPSGMKPLFLVCMAMSIFYLLVLALPILIQPMVGTAPLPLLHQSNLWLGPLQGLASSLLGVFFAREKAN
ncbi:hypothetical protein [Sphingomonas nostoxanthinifaciens]|uniref:hypothetical protein n=1 Tax=Sphingomonas nostoxanthinifaciens TaxID=2872652 RepID=UPI001CC21E08|nr:hypothetical protein [Sphingomonas nostoxanthinifaciens]UAK24522.1 hypothetical protein K8P63_19825 [Sphingomonas nostoxanthinifaciens]